MPHQNTGSEYYLRSDGSSSTRVSRNTRHPLLTGDARKAHQTIRAYRTGVSIEAVVTGMSALSARARDAGRATDRDLLLDMLVKNFDAGDIAIETVYLKTRGET